VDGEKDVMTRKTCYYVRMATKQSTAEYIADQVAEAGDIRVRKMFGEYALYCNDKVVALICDDQFFIKPTSGGKEFMGKVKEKPPYPGSKPFYLISEEKWEEREWMTELVRITEEEVPVPKPKKRRV
jgi:DNA transformation protein